MRIVVRLASIVIDGLHPLFFVLVLVYPKYLIENHEELQPFRLCQLRRGATDIVEEYYR